MRNNPLSLLVNQRLVRFRHPKNSTAGVTLIEMLVVLSLTAMLAAFTAPAITFGRNPLRDTSSRLAASFKLARARAMAETSAVRIRPLSSTEFVMERATRCSDTTWTNISDRGQKNGVTVNEDLSFDSPAQLISPTQVNGAVVTPVTNWNLCFNSRGMADKTVQITIRDSDANKQRTITVFQGGSVDLGNIS
ncbi:MAG: prepilin-type N-terminal cleavage/methylation domain-containing protein [Acaryochloridaceae cyanobacterium SU_2_1]|nr:prepilin-type N-terminal cleavage/methylation domain-containing protein [Acaryochloridaceae cyanobacterium SU_2_1]